MTQLTKLEKSAISAILRENPQFATTLERQLGHVRVTQRENTGSGFFTDVEITGETARMEAGDPLGNDVFASIDGLEYGIGLLLFLKDGRISLLEGYAVCESTEDIDFETVSFKITNRPGPYS